MPGRLVTREEARNQGIPTEVLRRPLPPAPPETSVETTVTQARAVAEPNPLVPPSDRLVSPSPVSLAVQEERKRLEVELVVGSSSPAVSLAMQNQALTKEAIVKMAGAGLSEDLIISVIQDRPGKYSLTADDLIKLKQDGISEKVLAVMLSKDSNNDVIAMAPSAATPNAGVVAAGDPNDPMTPHSSGIYLYAKDGTGNPKMTALNRVVHQGVKSGRMLSISGAGLVRAGTKAALPGPRASTRTPEPGPVFYFYLDDKAAVLDASQANVSNPNDFALIKLDVKKSNREAVITASNVIGAYAGATNESVVVFKSERIRPGLYKVTLDHPLEPESTASWPLVLGLVLGLAQPRSSLISESTQVISDELSRPSPGRDAWQIRIDKGRMIGGEQVRTGGGWRTRLRGSLRLRDRLMRLQREATLLGRIRR